jgi:flagellar hook-length control protein FliK
MPTAMASGATVTPAAITDMLDTMSPMGASSSVALPEESGWRSRRFNFVNDSAVQSTSASIASEGISKADSSEFADFMDSSAGSGAERGGEMPARPLATPGMIVSMTAEPRPDVAPTSTATALIGNLSSPTSISLATTAPQGAASGETSMVLQTPDAKLSFGERVQAFADAVAQRVIGQIREENWSVRMQLEPANLGTMDIDLSLKGNVVAATVGVANQDVRALLESGLPRLRESLESAGLQLSGWNFGQAGSRAFNDSAKKFSQTVFRGRIDETGSVTEVDSSRMMPIRNAASGKIDLFV